MSCNTWYLGLHSRPYRVLEATRLPQEADAYLTSRTEAAWGEETEKEKEHQSAGEQAKAPPPADERAGREAGTRASTREASRAWSLRPKSCLCRFLYEHPWQRRFFSSFSFLVCRTRTVTTPCPSRLHCAPGEGLSAQH